MSSFVVFVPILETLGTMHLFHGQVGFQNHSASIESSEASREELYKQYYIYKYNANLERNQLFFNFHRNATWFLDRYSGNKYDLELAEAKRANIGVFLGQLNRIKVSLSSSNTNLEWVESFVLPLKKRVITCHVPPHFTIQHVEFISKFPGVKKIDLTYPRFPSIHTNESHAIGRRTLFIECNDTKVLDSVLDSVTKLELADGNQIITLNPDKMVDTLQILDALDVLDTSDRRKADLLNTCNVCKSADRAIDGVGWLKVKNHLFESGIDLDNIDKLDDNQIQQALDLNLVYLRYGHLIEYYTGCVQATSIYHLLSYKKDITIRGTKTLAEEDEQFRKNNVAELQQDEFEGDSLRLPSERALSILDERVEYYLKAKDLSDPKDVYFGKQLQGEIVKKSREFIEVGEDNIRFTCKCCIKVFNAEHFARKHIKNKHLNQFEDLENEILLFNKYVSDPFRLKWRNTDNVRKRKYIDHDRTTMQIATNISFE
eukprot:NODE_389_length_9467_cov_0.241567.p2 type:complete len:487 gc:universal NODE_389_length_9467_cov_0.241567:8692-7232(-)